MFINNLEADLKREKGAFWDWITRSMRIGKAPGFKLVSPKERQIWENQFHELNIYHLRDVFSSLSILGSRPLQGLGVGLGPAAST